MAKGAKKVSSARRSRAAELLSGLQDIAHAIGNEAPPPGSVVRRYDIPEPSAYTSETVRAVRERFGVAQSFFAKMLGVSTILVGSWEQGKRTPNAIASRMLDAMAADPVAWLKLTKVSVPKLANELRGGMTFTIESRIPRRGADPVERPSGGEVHIEKRRNVVVAALRAESGHTPVGTIRKSVSASDLAARRRK